MSQGVTATSNKQAVALDTALDGPADRTESIDTALSKQKNASSTAAICEPLLTELGNEEIRFSEDAVQLLKFHGSYQQNHRELRKTDKFLLADDAAAANPVDESADLLVPG